MDPRISYQKILSSSATGIFPTEVPTGSSTKGHLIQAKDLPTSVSGQFRNGISKMSTLSSIRPGTERNVDQTKAAGPYSLKSEVAERWRIRAEANRIRRIHENKDKAELKNLLKQWREEEPEKLDQAAKSFLNNPDSFNNIDPWVKQDLIAGLLRDQGASGLEHAYQVLKERCFSPECLSSSEGQLRLSYALHRLPKQDQERLQEGYLKQFANQGKASELMNVLLNPKIQTPKELENALEKLNLSKKDLGDYLQKAAISALHMEKSKMVEQLSTGRLPITAFENEVFICSALDHPNPAAYLLPDIGKLDTFSREKYLSRAAETILNHGSKTWTATLVNPSAEKNKWML